MDCLALSFASLIFDMGKRRRGKKVTCSSSSLEEQEKPRKTHEPTKPQGKWKTELIQVPGDDDDYSR